jgi:hypothetical protein
MSGLLDLSMNHFIMRAEQLQSWFYEVHYVLAMVPICVNLRLTALTMKELPSNRLKLLDKIPVTKFPT